MHLRLGISPPSRCKGNENFANVINFHKNFTKIVAELTKKHYICTRKYEDSRIRQSESNDNRTRRHPVDLLAGHLVYIDNNEQSEATYNRRANQATPFKRDAVL